MPHSATDRPDVAPGPGGHFASPGAPPAEQHGQQAGQLGGGSSRLRRVAPRLAQLLADAATWAFALGFATYLRFDGVVSADALRGLLVTVAVAAGLQIILGLATRLYLGGYRSASLDEAVAIAGIGLFVGVALLGLAVFVSGLTAGPRLVPLSVPFGGTMTAVLGMVMIRAVVRRWREGSVRARVGTRALVFGAGDGGAQLIRSMVSDAASPYVPVGLLDDDPGKRHLRISGVRVLGTRHDVAAVAAARRADTLVIAVPTGDAALYRDLSDSARRADLEVKVLPGLADLLAPSHISIRDVRDIDMTDVLGRHQIDTDVDTIAGYLADKRVLVTGAGGSIGSELCRQLARYAPAELMLLDRDESALHAVQLSLRGRALMDTDDVILADIRDRDRIFAVFAERRPEVVFHAAALKHVPMLEQYPSEGYQTNVVGTATVVEASRRYGVDRFVNISTDKAANPTSVLGRTKRLAERVTAHVARDAPGAYLSVRFGNVLGSRGSVLTSFAQQVADGGPVTVTHPEVTRYFMTIAEAVQLVIQAAAIGRDGEALVLDMGEPVRIVDVARQLIDMAGHPVDIIFTGLRPGEKLHEELFGVGEVDERPYHPLISHVDVPPLAPELVQLADVMGDPAPTPRDTQTTPKTPMTATPTATTPSRTGEHAAI